MRRLPSMNQAEGHHQTLNLSTFILYFLPPELGEINVNKCCLSHPVYGLLLQQPEWTNLLLKKSLFSFWGVGGRGMMFLAPEESKWPVQYCSPFNHCMKSDNCQQASFNSLMLTPSVSTGICFDYKAIECR